MIIESSFSHIFVRAVFSTVAAVRQDVSDVVCYAEQLFQIVGNDSAVQGQRDMALDTSKTPFMNLVLLRTVSELTDDHGGRAVRYMIVADEAVCKRHGEGQDRRPRRAVLSSSSNFWQTAKLRCAVTDSVT